MAEIKKPVRASEDDPINVLDADGQSIAAVVSYHRPAVIKAINGRDAAIAYIADVKNGVSHKAFNDLMRILGEL